MTEDQLIQKYFASPTLPKDVCLGIGDDAAILDVPSGHQLITSVDTLLEDVHFPKGFSPQQLASRAVAVCVSDLAAMGAQARWLTLAISLPQVNPEWLNEFSQALHQHCSHYEMALVGGDTVKGKLALTLNVMGLVEEGKALRRDGAQVDDLVYVSGSLGGAALALSKLFQHEKMDNELLYCFTQPQARLGLGQALIGLVTSCMDVSDGILLDAARLAKASQKGIRIDLEKLPLNPAIHDISFEKALKFATSGDDYELLFTIPSQNVDKISQISHALNLPLTRIGRVVAGPGLESTYRGQACSTEMPGYQHF